MQLNDIIIAVQKEFGVTADGKAGPQTWNAIYQRLVNHSKKIPPALELISPVDERSEKTIATLQPEVQAWCTKRLPWALRLKSSVACAAMKNRTLYMRKAVQNLAIS